MQSEWTQLRALVFDFDGTLATCPYDFARMRQAVLGAAAAFDIDTEALDEDAGLLETIDLGVTLLADRPDSATAFRTEAMACLCALEYEAAGYTVLLPGAVQALQDLHGAGFRLGIITRNSAAAVARIIGETALPVAHVLPREAVPYPKPHPDHAQRMLSLLSCASHQALMVGDHPMDIATGQAVGMGTVAVLTGQTDEPTLRSAAPDLLFPSVVEMADALLQRG